MTSRTLRDDRELVLATVLLLGLACFLHGHDSVPTVLAVAAAAVVVSATAVLLVPRRLVAVAVVLVVFVGAAVVRRALDLDVGLTWPAVSLASVGWAASERVRRRPPARQGAPGA